MTLKVAFPSGHRALICTALLVVAAVPRVHAADPDVLIVADEKTAAALEDVIARHAPKLVVDTVGSLQAASNSKVETLIVFEPDRRRGQSAPAELALMRERKVIGVGYGVAQRYGELGLEINGGACAHFGRTARPLAPQPSELIPAPKSIDSFVPYVGRAAGADNFGMYVPRGSADSKVVDVVARAGGDENYAPIVRQRNHVLVGYTAAPGQWSHSYQSLFADTVEAVEKRRLEPFQKAKFPIQKPGEVQLALARGRSLNGLVSRSFHFRFEKPTTFRARLDHEGSTSMMLIFMGQKERLHWTRKDAKNGEALEIEIEVTERDLDHIGDAYWTLKVTNFDTRSPARGTLRIDYGKE